MGTAKDEQFFRSFTRELINLKTLVGDRHIVQLAGCYIWKSDFGILLEPAAEQDLEKYLETYQISPQEQREEMESVPWQVFGCLCITLNSICKTKRMRHKDIKPANILIHNNDVLFTDFGSAIAFLDARGISRGTNPGAVTDMYCAPEVIRREPRDMTADVFSLGCVYLEVITALVKGDGNLRRSFNGDSYAEDLPKVKKLLAELEKESDNELSSPLLWCSRMLEERERCPTIDELIKEIITDSGKHLFQFFCKDCLKELLFTALEMFPANQGQFPAMKVSHSTMLIRGRRASCISTI